MCKSLNVAVNKCTNWCFVHLFIVMTSASANGYRPNWPRLAAAISSISMVQSRNDKLSENPILWPWPLKFSRVLAVVEVYVRAKFNQTKKLSDYAKNSTSVATADSNNDDDDTIPRCPLASLLSTQGSSSPDGLRMLAVKLEMSASVTFNDTSLLAPTDRCAFLWSSPSEIGSFHQ